MAYYSSSYSGSDYGEYNFNSYAVNYDYEQVPAFVTYNSYDYNQPNYGYDSSLYFSPNYPDHNSYQTIAYSATTFNDPKSVVHDPNYGMTQLVLSYSTLEFNVPAFDEYDPTPYGGGYDIAETYGKPLPPSDKICYPRSGSSSIPISTPFDTTPAGSIVPIPTAEEAIDEKAMKPQNGTEEQTTEDKPQSQDSTTDLKPYEGEDSEESHDEDDDYNSGSCYGSGFGNGYSGGQFDENDQKQVPPQYPSGYGLESLDLCESLFGYWPCLSRMKERNNCCCEECFDRGNNCQENVWKGTADYLFGNPYPYGGSSHGGELVYGYERH